MANPFPIAPVFDHYGVYVNEDRTGWQPCLCPVHDEHRPSCSVNVEFGWFNCKACGQRGTAVDIIRIREGVDVATAVGLAEDWTGVSRDTLLADADEQPRRSVPSGQVGFRPRFGRRQAVRAGFRPGPHPWA